MAADPVGLDGEGGGEEGGGEGELAQDFHSFDFCLRPFVSVGGV